MIGEGSDHPLTKICSICQQDKLFTEYHKRSNRKSGIAPACKDCKKKIAKNYYDNNFSKVKEDSSRWKKENPDRVRNYKNAWNRANPQPARNRASRWMRENPERVKANTHARRARELAASGEATPEQIQARLDYYGNKCIYCKGPYEHLDHFYPLARGGTNWPANLVPSCGDCNRSKNARNPWRFIESGDWQR